MRLESPIRPGTGDPGEPGAGGEQGDSPWLTGNDLAIEIESAEVAGETAAVAFRLTDGAGVPLDREGLLTEAR